MTYSHVVKERVKVRIPSGRLSALAIVTQEPLTTTVNKKEHLTTETLAVRGLLFVCLRGQLRDRPCRGPAEPSRSATPVGRPGPVSATAGRRSSAPCRGRSTAAGGPGRHTRGSIQC